MNNNTTTTPIDYFKNLRNEHNYNLFVTSGMFWSCYPELTGDYEKDKVIIDNTAINE